MIEKLLQLSGFFTLFLAITHSNVHSSVVAVHGLCGDPYETWTEEASKKLWLKDFLPSQVPNTRIMSFGYDSLVAFSKSEIEIRDVAVDLLNRLGDERDTNEVIWPGELTADTRADAAH